MPTCFSYHAFLFVEIIFGQKINSVAAHHRFPVQTVTLVQHLLGKFRPTIHFRRRTQQGIYFLNVYILTSLLIGNDHSRMPSLTIEGEHDDVPLVHNSFQIFGRADHGRLSPLIDLL